MRSKAEKNRDKRRRKLDRKRKPGIERAIAAMEEAQKIAEALSVIYER